MPDASSRFWPSRREKPLDLSDIMWIVLCAIIVFEMQAGFLCLEAGFVRSKNAANVALKNMADFCIVSILFWAVGFTLMHGSGGNGLWGWGDIFPDFHDAGATVAGENGFFLFHLAFAAAAATIVSGAVAERERFKGYVILAALIGALVYPAAGHWIWGGSWPGGSVGWLAELGFVDFAGATAVHSVGGWAALCAIIALGPRLGRFTHKCRNFEEHSVTLSALGTLFLWIGWTGFNGGSALIFDVSVPTIVVHTMLTAAFGGVTAIFLSSVIDRHVRIDRVLNGTLAGLVAGTAGVHLYDGQDAAIAGVVGAVAMFLAAECLDRLALDDVVGAVPVHLAGGLSGTVLVPFLAPVESLPAGSVTGQVAIQTLGSLAVGAWVFATVLPAALLLRRSGVLRARPRDEVIGLDLAENRKSNAFQELLDQMGVHSRHGTFSRRVRVERSTQAGALALGYNRVLERVDTEMNARMRAVEREQALRERAIWAARHDHLTGLGNRTMLDELSQKDVDGSHLIIAMDLDRFKDANDAYGHEAGDVILKACAARLRSLLRSPDDHALRIGGDEFVLVLAFEDDMELAAFFADQVLEAIVPAIQFGSADLHVGASIGYALCTDGRSMGRGLKEADLALYEAKNTGRNRVVPFSAQIGAMHDNKMVLVEDFKKAIRNGEICIFLQPQVDARTRKLCGMEALARWEHPSRGLLRPDVFLPIATELKMLDDLDATVLDLALAARERLHDRLGYAPHVSVNVSARRLLDPALVEDLRRRNDLPKHGLSFEILETAFLDDEGDRLTRRIAELKTLGIGIEVDDFGTGHASFASVLLLRPDRLKIDRVFVDGLDKDAARRDLVQGIIEMAKTVSAEVVVEGVETEAQADVLTDLGANVLQGYLFARPLAISALEAWLNDHISLSEAG
jgi:Amt family ammonium transporter